MSKVPDEQPIKTKVDLTADFQAAAGPELDVSPEEPEPELDFNPPGPAGPSLGGVAPGAPGVHDRNVSPPLRGEDPPSPLSLKERFNPEARQGAFREMFNRKAKERENDNDLGR